MSRFWTIFFVYAKYSRKILDYLARFLGEILSGKSRFSRSCQEIRNVQHAPRYCQGEQERKHRDEFIAKNVCLFSAHIMRDPRRYFKDDQLDPRALIGNYISAGLVVLLPIFRAGNKSIDKVVIEVAKLITQQIRSVETAFNYSFNDVFHIYYLSETQSVFHNPRSPGMKIILCALNCHIKETTYGNAITFLYFFLWQRWINWNYSITDYDFHVFFKNSNN